MLNFKWAIKADNVNLYNPYGTVAICSLWTPPNFLEKYWREQNPELFCNSPLALIGGLYGGGLPIMLRNLHYNPQIDSVILQGKDYKGTACNLKNFFKGLLERSSKRYLYIFPDGRQEELEKITILGGDTLYSLDGLLDPKLFLTRPEIFDWTKEGYKIEKLNNFLENYVPKTTELTERPDPIALPKPVVYVYPSEPASHTIVADTITSAWSNLLFRLSRFGKPVKFRNGKERNELLNMKVVIKNPGQWSTEELEKYNLSPANIKEYQDELINPELSDPCHSYSYGNRLRKYFGPDLLEIIARDLAIESDSRHCYATLWDNNKDLRGHDAPCLVSIFFRKIDGQVNLTASFRSHNGARAWPVNCFGLYNLLERLCEASNNIQDHTETMTLKPGEMTIFSHSISLDPADLFHISNLIDDYNLKTYRMVDDPCGYFRLEIDLEAKELVVFHHCHTGELLTTYRASNPEKMSQLLCRDLTISNFSHAMYLGSQLERACYCLNKGLKYTQDKTKLS